MKETCFDLFRQGVSLLNANRASDAIEVFTRIIESPQCEPELKAQALNHRGFAWFKEGNGVAAVADWHAVLGMSGVSDEQRRMAELAGHRAQTMGIRLLADSARIGGDRDLAISAFAGILDDEKAHEFEKLMAAQGLLAIPCIPDNLAEKARQFLDSVPRPGRIPGGQRPPPSRAGCFVGCLVFLAVAVGGALALFLFFGGLAGLFHWITVR